jgi:23S rRNA G2069 N7-methylase RlmK/C1962 C5-methylase RlmI
LAIQPANHPTPLHRRLINSEGDGLSGLVVDVLGPCAVVQSCAAWVERYRPQVCAVVAAAAGISADSIVWRPATEILKEEVRGCRAAAAVMIP